MEEKSDHLMPDKKETNYLIVGTGLIGHGAVARALAAHIAESKREVILLDAKEEIKEIDKQRNRGIVIETEPFVLEAQKDNAPLYYFPEPKNFINGKKLPKKKRRK